MRDIASTPRELKARYPYQFSGPLISESYPAGWFALFSDLCRDVDRLLGANKRGFRWIQIKEKMGAARLYYTLEFFSKESDDPDQDEYVWTFEEELLANRLALLVRGASRSTAHNCAVCGGDGRIQSHEGYALAVCDAHQAQRLAGRWVQDFYLDAATDQEDRS
jgi:hypothetical protein